VLSIECVLYGVRSRLEDGVYDVTENLECFLESVLYSGREGLDLVSIRGHRPMYICTYTHTHAHTQTQTQTQTQTHSHKHMLAIRGHRPYHRRSK
jgi:hypothetical protein